MGNEVAIAGRSTGRDDGHTQGHIGPGQRAVHVDDAFLSEAGYHLPATADEVAASEFGVDVGYDCRESEGRMEIDAYAHHDFEVGSELLPCCRHKIGAYAWIVGGPDDGSQTRHGATRNRVFLYEFEITVATADAQVAGLGSNPDVAQAGVGGDSQANALIELRKAKGLIHL